MVYKPLNVVPINSIDALGMSRNAPKTDQFRLIILLFPVCLNWIYLSCGQVWCCSRHFDGQ